MKIFLILILFLNHSAFSKEIECIWINVKKNLAKDYVLTPNASFEEISEAFDVLKKFGVDKKISIEAKRLVNYEDWYRAMETSNKPWLTYGEIPISDWERGSRFIEALPLNTTATPTLLKQIHIETSKNLPFHGFEGRRLRVQYDKGLMTKEEFQKALQEVYKENAQKHGIDHTDLTGVFRSSPYDDLLHRGSSTDENGNRFFNRKEMDAMIENTFIKASAEDFKEVAPGKYTGTVKYHDPRKVSKAVSEVLARTEVELSKSKSLIQSVTIIQRMKRDLISIHPFLDGNGRTIRLMEDFMMKRLKLPPALHPNEHDLDQPIVESVEFARKNMIIYMNSYFSELAH